ncbi:MAG: aminoacetone oxidase family FAD-binding enzyme [Gemmatimonadetes bacterium]|nr:aminoacetone oxidase family FAD-binding enzyme [Gemmatimonadota bacterium]
MRPVAVVGAGAAGLMAALAAAREGRSVVLLERTPDGGRKILISGGGRCNILPSRAQPGRYVTDSSPNALKRMLRAWPLDEQRAFFERELDLRLELEPETGKLFPETHRARDVRDGLVARVREAGARLWMGTSVTGLVPPADDAGPWTVELAGAPPLEAAAVVIATGGLSVPATGSDGTGLEIVRALGHRIRPTYPALTPLLADPPVHAHLAGISLDVTLRAPGARPRFDTRGGFLFTHRGYSGPTVLDASHVAIRSALAGERQELTVRWIERDFEAWDRVLVEDAGSVLSKVAREIPNRLAERLLEEQRAELARAREQSQQVILEGRQAAERLRDELLTRTRAEQEELIARARRDIEQGTRRAIQEIRNEVADLTIMATEKVTRKSLTDDDQRRLVDEALSELDFASLAGEDRRN